MERGRHWTEFDRATLAEQYDNRGAVPDHPEIFRRWEECSIRARKELRPLANLAYGAKPRQALDLFRPRAASPAPLHVFFHGGYWQAMSKDSFSFVARGLVERGFAVAIVNYRLCPAVRIAQIVDDARNACLWLFRNAASLRVDASRIQVSGHSAGGHLMAMIWATQWRDFAPGPLPLPNDWIHSGISISGLFELEPLVFTPVNDALGMDVKEARELSPVVRHPVSQAPLMLAVGELESEEYHRQGAFLQNVWHKTGLKIKRITLKNRNHFTILDDLANEDGALLRIASYLRNNPNDVPENFPSSLE
jgi:arylformamidase